MFKRLKYKTGGILNYSDYKKPVFKIVYLVFLFFLFVAVLTALTPPLWLFLSSFKEAEELTAVPYRLFPKVFNLKKLVEVWSMLNFGKYFFNTIIVVLGAILCSVVFNGLLAYTFAIIKPSGYKFFYALVLGSYMIPAFSSIVPLYKQIVDLNLKNSYLPLWLVFGANAFYLIMMKNYFESLPKSIFEAAAMDRCNPIKTFFLIVVPLSKPILSVVAIFTMTAAWSDFLLPHLVLDDKNLMTVMVKIYDLKNTMGSIQGFGPDKLLMVLTISILPQIFIFAIFQKRITASSYAGAIKE
jgi:multiple sugar transport system permease protein